MIFLVLPPVNFADIGVFDISIIRRENIKMKEQNNSVAMCCLFLDPTPEVMLQYLCGKGKEFAFLTTFQVMLKLPVQEPPL